MWLPHQHAVTAENLQTSGFGIADSGFDRSAAAQAGRRRFLLAGA